MYLYLIIIFLVALFMRLYNLGDTPAGFHQDEVVNAFVGRYIFHNGFDLFGNNWPLLFFDKRGDFPPVIPMYISSLGTFIFGFTQLAARLPIALIGAIIVFPVYFITNLIFKKNHIALFAAFMIAIIPWHVAFSRIGAEGIVATTAFMFGLWLFLLAISKKNISTFVGSLFLLFSTYLLYPSFRITVPLVLLAAIFFYRDLFKEAKKLGIILLIATVLSFILTIYISSTVWGRGRYEQTSLVSKFQGVNNPANRFIYNEKNILTARVFNNKLVYIGRDFMTEYMSYFSPQFLFGEAGRPDWFKIPNSGLLFFTQSILLMALFLPFLYSKNPLHDSRTYFFLLTVMLIAPIASALTAEFTPNMHRSILLSVMIIFPLVYGFALLQNFKYQKLVNTAFFTLLVIEFVFFFHNYFQHVSMYTSVLRGDGNRQMVEYLQKERTKYDKVYMLASGWFPVYYTYFTQNLDTSLVGKFRINMRADQIDNVYFIEEDCPNYAYYEGAKPRLKLNPSESVLMIANSACAFNFIYMFDKVGEIIGADKVPVYYIYRFNSDLYKKEIGKRDGINFR